MTASENSEIDTRLTKIHSSINTNGYSPEKQEISKFRQALPQICAVSAKNLLLVTLGSTLGFSTILLPALQKDNPDIAVTREEITWISSINLFVVPFGCLISGPISHYLGRKRTMLLANIPFITAWIVLYFATTAPFVFLALALTGLTGGLCEAPVLTYVAEVTQPHLRGMLSATSSMAVIIGVFTQLLTGSLTDWRTVALINLTYPALCFMALCIMPESPYWLVAKDRLDDAEKSLCWLRGWVSPSHVREELTTVIQVVRRSFGNESSKESNWTLFKKRTFILPFILVNACFFISTFGGSATLQTFAVYIFANMKAPLNKYTATVFLGVAEIIGTAVCVFAIHFTGKRKISFASIAGTAICFLGSAVYGYLIYFESIDTNNYTWIPTSLLIGAAFFSHMGIRLLPWILCGEVFPSKGRGTATGAAASAGYIYSSIVNKIFLYMVDWISLSGTFLFYAAINIIGYIVLFYLLPETEGRTLKEIENHYAGIEKLHKKPNKGAVEYKEKWAASNPGLNINDESKL